jgi:hypothetical protein
MFSLLRWLWNERSLNAYIAVAVKVYSCATLQKVYCLAHEATRNASWVF